MLKFTGKVQYPIFKTIKSAGKYLLTFSFNLLEIRIFSFKDINNFVSYLNMHHSVNWYFPTNMNYIFHETILNL